MKGGAAETNLVNQLIAINVPYNIDRSDRLNQVIRAFEKGECEKGEWGIIQWNGVLSNGMTLHVDSIE